MFWTTRVFFYNELTNVNQANPQSCGFIIGRFLILLGLLETEIYNRNEKFFLFFLGCNNKVNTTDSQNRHNRFINPRFR